MCVCVCVVPFFCDLLLHFRSVLCITFLDYSRRKGAEECLIYRMKIKMKELVTDPRWPQWMAFEEICEELRTVHTCPLQHTHSKTNDADFQRLADTPWSLLLVNYQPPSSGVLGLNCTACHKIN